MDGINQYIYHVKTLGKVGVVIHKIGKSQNQISFNMTRDQLFQLLHREKKFIFCSLQRTHIYTHREGITQDKHVH